MKKTTALLLLAALAVLALDVPNPSFEIIKNGQPANWTLDGQGGLADSGADGQHAIFATGDKSGENNSYWFSTPLDFAPNTAYQLSFLTRKTKESSGGTVVCGPVFCNFDIGNPPEAWTEYTRVFVTPSTFDSNNSQLRFGHWHSSGRFDFDRIAVTPVVPIYIKKGSLVLGEGEQLDGNNYTCTIPFNTTSRNHSRCLRKTNVGFNTNRWCFGKDGEVIYAHSLEGREQLSGKLSVTINYHVSGSLKIQASKDGQNWMDVATLDNSSSFNQDLPGSLFPAHELQVRLLSQASQGTDAKHSDPGAFQINNYAYTAVVSGEPATMVGATQFVEIGNRHPDVDIQILSLGNQAIGQNTLSISLTNNGRQALQLTPAATITAKGEKPGQAKKSPSIEIPQGTRQTVDIPYELPATGLWNCLVDLDKDTFIKFDIDIPAYFDNTYGELLANAKGVAVWSASSAWKINPSRSVPRKKGYSLDVELAANEAEAVQLVLTPDRELKNLSFNVSNLTSENGQMLPVSAVEILNVYYHDIQSKTDATGVLGLWPDALPPISGPVTLKPNMNQPFWVRVTVPKGTAPGTYQGTIAMRAQGWSHTINLHVKVFDFELPDTMTCQTAFGFNPNDVFIYHNVKDIQMKRVLLDKYLSSFAAHHISPYNPVPFDSFRCRLDTNDSRSTVANWPYQHGKYISADTAEGKTAILLDDSSDKSMAWVECERMIPLPEKDITIQFKYKTGAPGHKFIFGITHYDANKNWIYGQNTDIAVIGDGTWQTFSQNHFRHPPEAEYFMLRIYATVWTEDGGSALGKVMLDDVKIIDNQDNSIIVQEGFEPRDTTAYKVVIDWEAWDQALSKALERYHFNCFSLPVMGLGSGTFHSRTEPNFFGFAENTPEYQRLHNGYLAELDRHICSKNWQDKAFVYWFDEPDRKDYEFVMNGFKKLKANAPHIRRMLTEQVEQDLIGGPNLWCPETPYIGKEDIKARQRENEQFWWYVCTGPKAPYATLFIDHPGTEMRVWLWQTWDYNVQGILVWQTNHWHSHEAYPDKRQNPYTDPMSWTVGYSTAVGSRLPWGNGDGRFLYPPLAAANGDSDQPVLDGPVDSIRWEMLRDGVEDYEYFVILKKRLAQNGQKLSATDRERLEKLLTVPQAVTKSMTEFTTSPAPIEAHRRLLAEAISQLK